MLKPQNAAFVKFAVVHYDSLKFTTKQNVVLKKWIEIFSTTFCLAVNLTEISTKKKRETDRNQ
jgi:hypothetical protein